MKNKILCLIGLLLFFNNANAQLTLKEAINRSISTNKGIEAAKKNVEAKTNNVQSAYGRYLPNINFDITYNYIDRDIVIDLSPIRSAMISLQANNQVGFSNLEALLKTGAPLTAEQQQAIKQGATEKLNNSIPEFEKTLKERAFPKATFTINQPIFTGGKISAGVDASRAQKELELKKLDAETAEIVSQVINAYINVLIAEERIDLNFVDSSCNKGKPFFSGDLDSEGETAHEHRTVHAHLDKSHVTVHTFPEYHPDNSISTFRVDIDVSTCGEISPLNTLNYLIDSFDSDIITIDYRVRGFTRDVKGKKYFIDHNITSIQDYINSETLTKYDAIDVNVYQSNIFHTKLLIKEIELQNYLFNKDVYELSPKQRLEIIESLRKEMIEIFSGMNIY
mgnify:CR=1 FL=1